MWREAAGAGRLRDLPPPEHGPAEAREAADEILSRPEYDWAEPSRSTLEKVAEWIADRLSDWFGGGGGDGGGAGPSGGGTLPTWVGYLVLILLVALVGLLIYRSRRGLRLGREPRRPGSTVVVDEGEEERDWVAEAVRHESEGEWREGLRCRYRALVGELADRRVIPDLVGRTAGEFAGDVRRACPPASAAFGRATGQFEEAWYGGAPGGPAGRDRFAALADEVLAAAVAPRPGAEADDERPLVSPS